MVHVAKNPIKRSRRQMDGPDGCNGGRRKPRNAEGAIKKSSAKNRIRRNPTGNRTGCACSLHRALGLVAGLLCGKNGYQGLSVRLSMLHGFTAALTFLGG